MASSVESEKIGANLALTPYDHDPDGTTAAIVTPDAGTTERIWDMREFECFGVLAMSSALTGAGLTLVEIVASDSADMSTNVTQIKTSGAVVGDAVGDYVFLECLASEVAQASTDNDIEPGLRYVAGRLTVANAADEAVVVYVGTPKRPQSGLTATTIS